MYSLPRYPNNSWDFTNKHGKKMWRIFVKKIHGEPEVVDPCWSTRKISEKWWNHIEIIPFLRQFKHLKTTTWADVMNMIMMKYDEIYHWISRVSWWNMLEYQDEISWIMMSFWLIPWFHPGLKPFPVPSFSIRYFVGLFVKFTSTRSDPHPWLGVRTDLGDCASGNFESDQPPAMAAMAIEQRLELPRKFW